MTVRAQRHGRLAACCRAAAIVAALGATACAGGGAADTSAFTPVATIDQVMDAIVIPAAEGIFDAVVYTNGELTSAPQSDDDWFRVRMHALAVAEAGNLLLMPPRAPDADAWARFAQAMTEQAAVVAKAAETKDIEELLRSGSELYNTCTACHDVYLNEP